MRIARRRNSFHRRAAFLRVIGWVANLRRATYLEYRETGYRPPAHGFDRIHRNALEFRFMRRALLLAWLLASVVTTAAPLGAQTAKRPAITGIAFARFYTTDPTAAQKFYGDTLGFKRLEANGVWVYPVNASQWIEILASPPPKPDIRMASVAFTTRNAAGLERYLAAHGFQPELPLKEGEFGVRDPEGNLVIFVQSGSNHRVAQAPPSPDAVSRRIKIGRAHV